MPSTNSKMYIIFECTWNIHKGDLTLGYAESCGNLLVYFNYLWRSSLNLPYFYLLIVSQGSTFHKCFIQFFSIALFFFLSVVKSLGF